MRIPYRIVVSDKTLAAGKHEVKHRATGKIENLAEKELMARLIK
jgi:prolyl-tRNA synthetase